MRREPAPHCAVLCHRSTEPTGSGRGGGPAALVVPPRLHPVPAPRHRAPARVIRLAAIDQEPPTAGIAARPQPPGQFLLHLAPRENALHSKPPLRRRVQLPGEPGATGTATATATARDTRTQADPVKVRLKRRRRLLTQVTACSAARAASRCPRSSALPVPPCARCQAAANSPSAKRSTCAPSTIGVLSSSSSSPSCRPRASGAPNHTTMLYRLHLASRMTTRTRAAGRGPLHQAVTLGE